MFGGLYLPQSIELVTCVECVLSEADPMIGSGNDDPVLIVGDFNMRLGRLTDDLLQISGLTLNIRSRTWNCRESDHSVNGRSRCRASVR